MQTLPLTNNSTFCRRLLTSGLSALFVSIGFLPCVAQHPEFQEGESQEITVEKAEFGKNLKDASAFELKNIEESPKGFWAHGGFGDIVLKNDLSYFVFGAVPKEPSPDPMSIYRHGTILDATTSARAPENFQMFTPNSQGYGELSIQSTGVTFRPEANGKATVVVSGHETRFPSITTETEYTMFKDMPGVLATTTLTNTSASETYPAILSADYLRWGNITPFMPGMGWIPTGTASSDVEFVFGRHHDQWILIAPETGTLHAMFTTGTAALAYAPEADMEPGETRSYRRWILVGDQDPATLYSFILQRRRGIDTGSLVGRVIEREMAPDGAMIERGPVANCEIRIAPLLRPDWPASEVEARQNKPYIIALTKPNGQYDLLLPVGEYRVYPAPPDRVAPKPNLGARVRKDKVEAMDFGVSPPSRLVYQIVDEKTGQRVPGKLTIEPLRDSMRPILGPPGRVLSENTVLSSHGAGIVDLPPGNYRVVVSRGPEFHTTEDRIKIEQTKDTTQVFKIKRAFETPGWISAEVGARTAASPACRVSPESRVVSALAEGVEWLVSGDPWVATDLSPAVERLGLGAMIKTSPGYRFSGEKEPFLGDFLLFPTDQCATGITPDFGAIEKATTTDGVLEAMRALCPESAILVNRPIWPVFGYLTLQGYKLNDTRLPDGNWSKNFDAWQIWEGKRQNPVDAAYTTYHQLLRRGARVTAFGNTNSFGTWMDEVGYPRVYIASGTEDPSKLDPAELARNIKKGLVSVTNGPFVNVKVNGKPMGSLITDTDGQLDVDIEVYAANWVQIQSIQINLNGQFIRQILLPAAPTPSETGIVYPRQGAEESGRVTIKAKEDSVLDVRVQGSIKSPMDPVNPLLPPSRDPNLQRGQFPLAISAPIYVDVDGNGKLDPPTEEEIQQGENNPEVQDPPF